MKKTFVTLVALATLSTPLAFSAPVTIINFSGLSATADSPWVWNNISSTLSISGNNDQGLLYPDDALNVNISGNNELKLTIASTITTNPGGGFFISLESSNTGVAQAIFNWSSFTASTSATATLTNNPGAIFDPTNVINWNIGDGGYGGNGNLSGMTFVTLEAVPEPGTYALMAIAGVFLMVTARRRASTR